MAIYYRKNDGSFQNAIYIKGKNGTNGVNGVTPHIDDTTGNWVIGDKDTGVRAGLDVSDSLEGKNIVFLGDSVAMGQGNVLSSSGLGATPNGFQNCIKEAHPKANVYNFAVDGGLLTSVYCEALTTFGAYYGLIKDGLTKMIDAKVVPDYVIMDGCGNDIIYYYVLNSMVTNVSIDKFCRKTNNTLYEINGTATTICDSLEDMIIQVKNINPKCKIIYMTCPRITKNGQFIESWVGIGSSIGVKIDVDEGLRGLKTAFYEISNMLRKYNVQFVDLWHTSYDLSLAGNMEVYSLDGIHPTLQGYQFCYPAIEEALLNNKNDIFPCDQIKGEVRDDYPLLINDEFDRINHDLWCIRHYTDECSKQMETLGNPSRFKSSTVSIENNQLKIMPTHINGKLYASGLCAKVGVKKCLVEIRAKIPMDKNNQCAIWAVCQPPLQMGKNVLWGSSYPYCGEIDFFETQAWENTKYDKIASTSFSVDANANLTQIKNFVDKEITYDFHIYGIEISDEVIKTYIDRELVCTIKTSEVPMWNPLIYKLPFYICIGSEVCRKNIDNGAEPPTINPILIDWYRVYEIESDKGLSIYKKDGTELVFDINNIGAIPSIDVKTQTQELIFCDGGNLTNTENNFSGIFSANTLIATQEGASVVTVKNIDGSVIPFIVNAT